MGYTHYYRYACLDPTFQSAWPSMVADAGRIVDRVRDAGVVISDSDGPIPPVSTDGILINGSEADELDGEPLAIFPDTRRLGPWQYDDNGIVRLFCKTERLPYDLAVSAILLRCHLLAPEVFLIDSDGGWDQEWLKGVAAAQNLSARNLVAELFCSTPTASPFTDRRG